jgi:hypothetical protein
MGTEIYQTNDCELVFQERVKLFINGIDNIVRPGCAELIILL